MKTTLLIFIFLISFSNVYAVTISFSDYDLSSQEIDIYYSNGTKLTTVISNSSVTLDDSLDYQFVFRPGKINILGNPMLLFNYLEEGLAVIFTIGLLILGYKVLK